MRSADRAPPTKRRELSTSSRNGGGGVSGHGLWPEGVEALDLEPAQLVDAVHLVVVQGPADDPVDGAPVGVPEIRHHSSRVSRYPP